MSSNIDPNVYNGRNKVIENDKMFMNELVIHDCVMSLEIKNSKGFDSIPQRILVDGYFRSNHIIC